MKNLFLCCEEADSVLTGHGFGMQARRRSRIILRKTFYMHKYILSLTLVILGITELAAQPIISPYQYRKRWFVNLQTGVSLFSGEYTSSFPKGERHRRYSFYNEAILGYYFTDAHEIRASFAYAPRTSLISPGVFGYHPYSFDAVQFFVDYVVNWHPLGENNTAYNPQMYVGLGGAVTNNFSDLENIADSSDDDLDGALPRPYPLNIVPGIRLGVIFEYDLRNNLGFTVDLGGQFFHDRFNGQDPDIWPFDFVLNGTVGIVYHFKKGKK